MVVPVSVGDSGKNGEGCAVFENGMRGMCMCMCVDFRRGGLEEGRSVL